MKCRDVMTSLLWLVTYFVYIRAQLMPTSCSYDSGLYTCDYALLTSNAELPLQTSDFNPVPQRLRLNNMPATLSSAFLHADFENISTAGYDNNYPATLELECNLGSAVTITAGALANAEYVRDFKILNCVLGAIPANAFSGLGQLDRFTIENGTITSMHEDMLTNVTIYRNITAAYPENNGAFVIKNTKLAGTIPVTLFSNQTDMYELVLRNMGLTSINDTVFEGCPNIRHLDLSYNDMTEFPGSVMMTLSNLGSLAMYGTDVMGCTCSKLEFLGLQTTKYVEVHGDIVCMNTTDYENKLAIQYYTENCLTEKASCTDGVELLGSCLTPIDLTGFSLGTVAFILGWVVLGLTVCVRKQANGGSTGKVKPIPKAKPKAGGKTKPKSGWTK